MHLDSWLISVEIELYKINFLVKNGTYKIQSQSGKSNCIIQLRYVCSLVVLRITVNKTNKQN